MIGWMYTVTTCSVDLFSEPTVHGTMAFMYQPTGRSENTFPWRMCSTLRGYYLHPLFAKQNDPFVRLCFFICHFVLDYSWLQNSHDGLRFMEVAIRMHAAYCTVCFNSSETANMFSIECSMHLNSSNWFSAISLLTELCCVPPCSPGHTRVTITPVSQRHVIIM